MEIKKGIISEGLFLAGATLVGYACTYFFELGYNDFYQIPDNFIEIGIPNVIKNVGYTIAVLLFIVMTINALLSGIPRMKNNPFQNPKVIKLIIMFAAMLPFLMFSKFSATSIIIFSVVYVWFALSVYFDKQSKDLTPYAPLTLYTNKYGLKGYLILYLCLFIIALMPNIETLGYFVAKKQENYLIIQKPSNMVVLGTYRDNIIAAAVDLDKKEITPIFRFIKSENLEAEMVHTGRLIVVSNNSVSSSVYY